MSVTPYPKDHLKTADKELPCEHVQALMDRAKELQVEWWGCGECGSPQVTCRVCGLVWEVLQSNGSREYSGEVDEP